MPLFSGEDRGQYAICTDVAARLTSSIFFYLLLSSSISFFLLLSPSFYFYLLINRACTKTGARPTFRLTSSLFLYVCLSVLAFQLFQSPAELVGTAGGFVAASNAIKEADDLVGGATCHQLGDALRVTMTSSVEEAMADAPVSICLYIYELRASSVTCVKHNVNLQFSKVQFTIYLQFNYLAKYLHLQFSIVQFTFYLQFNYLARNNNCTLFHCT